MSTTSSGESFPLEDMEANFLLTKIVQIGRHYLKLLGARTLLGAPGRTTRSILTTRNKKLLCLMKYYLFNENAKLKVDRAVSLRELQGRQARAQLEPLSDFK